MHKDIEVAPRLALTQNQISSASTALAGGIASVSGSYGLTNHKTTLSGDATSDTSMAWSDGPGAGSGRSRGASTLSKSRGAAIVGEFGALAGGTVGGAGDARQESADSTFMDEVSLLRGTLLGDNGILTASARLLYSLFRLCSSIALFRIAAPNHTCAQESPNMCPPLQDTSHATTTTSMAQPHLSCIGFPTSRISMAKLAVGQPLAIERERQRS